MRRAAAFILAFAPVVVTADDVTLQLPEFLAQAEPVTTEKELLEDRIEELERAKQDLEKAKAAHQDATRAIAEEQERLERRIAELEAAQAAQEDATRAIIQESVSTLGSKINEFVTFGGALEVLAGRAEDFQGRSQSAIRLNTAELDFEIRANDWTVGSLIIEYFDGGNTLFATNAGFDTTIDRFAVNTASVTIGNPQKFPPFASFGRMFVPFGISTGDPVADVLTIEDPLTVEVFETQEDTILIGVAFPTPALTPATPPVTPPKVRPLVINPLVSSVSRGLGYDPPPKPPPPPTYITAVPPPPLFNMGVYFYNGDTQKSPTDKSSPIENIGATLGFRTKGNCGRSFDQLRGSAFCPWSIDVDVDYNNSVFDSLFLGSEYQSFLNQIGFVPGMAASVKGTLGPVSLVGEWNGAIGDATFTDDVGNAIRIRPGAWQVSLAYQFDWNPWVETIGAQGTYVAIGYSESWDLAGATQLIGGVRTRVGAVPEKRFILGAGEWVLDGLKVSIEYSHIIDYRTSEGGTGNSADGLFTALTYVW